jgi:hypothetical protein
MAERVRRKNADVNITVDRKSFVTTGEYKT